MPRHFLHEPRAWTVTVMGLFRRFAHWAAVEGLGRDHHPAWSAPITLGGVGTQWSKSAEESLVLQSVTPAR